MTMHEYGTIMEYGVNVKIILLNNNFWEWCANGKNSF